MFRERHVSERRLDRLRREVVKPNVWSPSIPFTTTMWAVPPNIDGTAGDPVAVEVALDAEFEPVGRGTPWGAPWATTWFRFEATIPDDYEGCTVEALLDLGFSGLGPGFHAEGMIWERSASGTWVPLRGVHPMNHIHRVVDAATPGERVEILVEAASNPILIDNRADPNSDVTTAGRDPIYSLGPCTLAVLNRDLYELDQDLRFLAGWAREMPRNEPRANELLDALDASMDALDPADPIRSAGPARQALARVMGRSASASAHRISAIGHAHIDSAWLWPIRETVRKCARTFSNALRLMEVDPEFRFGCSQAVQYEWMREHYPDVFARIVAATERGQWIPIGGQWVEADGNIPSGESHLRQLMHGQRFFREHLGVTCSEVWIPDVFGYPASLPQLFRLGGGERFLTQKLSWNRTNAFPHHTFWWEGIDGSRVYTHFPPVDTYNANLSARELAHAVHNFRDHGVASRSLMPFGHGDGGGGPSPFMLDQYHRSKDFEGSPRITIESPAQFFDAAIAENPNPPVWVGELYFEMHRGTYTSQARTKVGNRRAETALHEAELWSAAAFGGSPSDGYPLTRLDQLWKTVLLHQFHDILPGSSIGWVHREAEKAHAEVLDELDALTRAAVQHLAGSGAVVGTDAQMLLANATPFDRDEVLVVDGPPSAITEASDDDSRIQVLGDGRVAISVVVPAMALAPLVPGDAPAAVRVTVEDPNATTTAGVAPCDVPRDGSVIMDNGTISVSIAGDGSVGSLVESSSGRDAVPAGQRANVWQIHDDIPIEYDAWDIEEYYRRRMAELPAPTLVRIEAAGPLVARLRVERRFGQSSLVEVMELRAGSPRLDVHIELDWWERNRLLKIAWPVDVSTTEVIRDIAYGHVTTPIHTNTSWDAARFEISAHRWIDVCEGDFGVALLNDGRYGHDVTRTRTPDGAPTTTMRMTVAKGAQYPDPHADEGLHRFTYSLMPHSGSARSETLGRVIEHGYLLNMPIRHLAVDTLDPSALVPLVEVDDGSGIVEVVKAAEDGSGDLIIRVREALGNRGVTTLGLSRPVTEAWLTNALEDGPPPVPSPRLHLTGHGVLHLSLRPFQIATIRLRAVG